MAAEAASAVRAKARALNSAFDRELEERFLAYVRIDTQSDEKSETSPSMELPYVVVLFVPWRQVIALWQASGLLGV